MEKAFCPVQFDGLRTADSCRLFWKNAGHPAINTTKWMAEEDKLLVELAVKHGGVCWESVATELGVSLFIFSMSNDYS
jgi:Myb-like DNA-binding domain